MHTTYIRRLVPKVSQLHRSGMARSGSGRTNTQHVLTSMAVSVETCAQALMHTKHMLSKQSSRAARRMLSASCNFQQVQFATITLSIQKIWQQIP